MKQPYIEEAGAFYCTHIQRSDRKDIRKFQIHDTRGKGLLDYLKDCALDDETAGEARTYMVWDKVTDELVAYFTLKAGSVTLNEQEPPEISDESKGTESAEEKVVEFDTLPGIELADFAVNDAYKEKHKNVSGIGTTVLVRFVLPLVRKAAEYIGVNLLYIYSLPYESLINYYSKMGFSRFSPEDERKLHHRIKPRYDVDCIFMWLPLTDL